MASRLPRGHSGHRDDVVVDRRWFIVRALSVSDVHVRRAHVSMTVRSGATNGLYDQFEGRAAVGTSRVDGTRRLLSGGAVEAFVRHCMSRVLFLK